LREAREAAYWLRICEALELAPAADPKDLSAEAIEISKILGAIVRTKLRMRVGYAVLAFCILNFAF
jgi:four helix bundle protein